MRDRTRWKGLAALAMAAAMLFSQTAVYAQEEQPVEQTEDLGQMVLVEETEAVNGLHTLSASAQADENGFVIEDGVLTAYKGTDTKVVVPDGVTSIGYRAFYGCTKLTDITLPESVISIGESAFNGCSSLRSITILDGVTSIGNSAFYRCTSLTDIAIPNSVTRIGSYAFEYCASLTDIKLPESMTSIGGWAFHDCGSLRSITIPNGVTSIDSYTFWGCSGLANITLPDSVIIIGGWAFDGCRSLANITIPNRVTRIEGYAFHDCGSLSSITIPKSVTYIGISVFSGCSVELTIYGTSGSYAETYAAKSNIKFVPKEAAQTFSYTKSYSKAYGCKAFTLDAKLKTGDGKLTYASSDKKVATVKNGKVTVTGTGVATITVTAAGTANYKKTSVKVTIKVSPAKQTLKSLKTVKGRKLTVTWKKDTRATGYQIQYSTDKNFKKGVKTATVSKNTTLLKTITKLTAGKRYYVRVRSYKSVKVSGKTQKLYGAWSSAKRSGSIKK